MRHFFFQIPSGCDYFKWLDEAIELNQSAEYEANPHSLCQHELMEAQKKVVKLQKKQLEVQQKQMEDKALIKYLILGLGLSWILIIVLATILVMSTLM